MSGANAETQQPARQRSRSPGAKGREDRFQVAFEHGRWRHFGWLVAGLLAGGFLLVKLGTVGKAVGVALILIGILNGVRFARTLMHPAGSIEVDEEGVALPDGLCRKGSCRVGYGGIRHAFFLRRSVPWTLTGPVLVIETEDRVFRYPRDWFTSDSDQRRVAHAIHRRLESR